MDDDAVMCSRPIRVTTWIDEALVRQAKAIGAVKDETIAEVIERNLRAPLAREYRETMAAEVGRDLGGEG